MNAFERIGHKIVPYALVLGWFALLALLLLTYTP